MTYLDLPAHSVERQNAFDRHLADIGDEGTAAHKTGIALERNPYAGSADPHERNAWAGGWASSALGLDADPDSEATVPAP